MRLVERIINRLLFLAFSLTVLFVILTQILGRLDQHLPFIWALTLTYFLSAYIILPQLVRFCLMILKRGRIPRVTYTSDGLAADPVNILLKGTYTELTNAFHKAGWTQADPLTLRSSLKMVQCFLLNIPYPQAPFSPLFLFGRKQDIGFQEAVSRGPRKRHHVRFWAANINPQAEVDDLSYWIHEHPVDYAKPLVWVGAGTEDLGFGLTSLTYQISHRSDKAIDKERDYLLSSLKAGNTVTDISYLHPGDTVEGKYVSDGKILMAVLR